MAIWGLSRGRLRSDRGIGKIDGSPPREIAIYAMVIAGLSIRILAAVNACQGISVA